tara:strand:+ start:2268 stop:2789 length:522 start_codon:yes stop_codon:yes gene_type:complete
MYKLFILLIVFSSCSKNTIKKIEENYDGPLIEIKNLNTFFTDSAQVRFQLKSELYQVFDEGEEIYPEGLYMDIYSRNSDSITATFEANHVIKFENENYYKATGNVVLFNIETGDELRTEELYWYPNDEKFLTEKFVTIKTGDEIHSGEGMESNQDFSSYEIIKPSGIIDIDEN